MPFITVEYTDNLKAGADIPSLLKKINERLYGEGDVFSLGSIRSSAIAINDYYIGNGEAENSFVHVTVKVGPGRPPQVKKDLFDPLFDTVKDHFTHLMENRYLALSMEIYEFHEGGTYNENNIIARYE
ncbi:5-carboxymethyl-2-hydroxymuconate Delta-isomerase [Virgibacillus kekensis]|uniref:5-carboxymethyl-2-hydroxymuconate Delta-isomerase n=1 Tax=Virgibacillus kekensis TaxID=202261 RepID=A0ABV9DIF1_9BACI